MKATIPYIEQKFEEFNQQMFAGKLPKLPIELSDAKSFLGICTFKTRKDENGKKVFYDFKLRINTRIDLPENVLEDTIIHEMIHYFIGYNNLEDTSSHGPIFLHLMNTFNEKYSRNITVSHRGTKEQDVQMVDNKPHWHVIAVITLHDGRCGLKVLPRVMQSILSYYNSVINYNGVSSIQLFMSNDVFFNSFPVSKALNFHVVDKNEIMDHLKTADLMTCDGKTLKRLQK